MDYDDNFVRGLEFLWGDGLLSPGGIGELSEIFKNTDANGKLVLDIGCGIGGFDRMMIKNHGVRQVVAIDIVEYLVDRARADAKQAGLAQRIDYRLVEPGPLDFDGETFDIVFTKDTIVHVEDKRSAYEEIFRVLKSGGVFAGSDWLGSDATGNSERVRDWLDYSGLEFYFCTARELRNLMEKVGFETVTTRDRTKWYLEEVRQEVAKVTGDSRKRFVELFGEETAQFRYGSSSRKMRVAEAGELCPTLIRAVKP